MRHLVVDVVRSPLSWSLSLSLSRSKPATPNRHHWILVVLLPRCVHNTIPRHYTRTHARSSLVLPAIYPPWSIDLSLSISLS